MERSVKKLNIVLIIVVRKTLELLFGEYTKGVIDTVEVLFPVVSPSCDVHSDKFLLFLFR